MPAPPSLQRQYRLIRAATGYRLDLVDAPVNPPQANEVLVQVRAASLNRRDILVMKGQYPMRPRESLVPLSDGAGEVVAVGRDVKQFQPGDRVAATFFQSWVNGRPGANVGDSALGGPLDGLLSQYVTLPEVGWVRFPAHLSFEEAATLPCAAVTAWNGFFTRGRLQAGDYVLLEGTGGVSILGLQLALAAGAKPILTSSSEVKLERAKALGAISTINHKTTPQWGEAVRAATHGLGVHQILEVGGRDSLPQALASLAPGGHLALVGGLGGFGGEIPALGLMFANATVSGIYVGSRENFEALNAFIAQHQVRPIVDQIFAFDEARRAYELMESGQHFGKIVIRV